MIYSFLDISKFARFAQTGQPRRYVQNVASKCPTVVWTDEAELPANLNSTTVLVSVWADHCQMIFKLLLF